MLVSAMPAFAYFADDVAIPKTGVLRFIDFDNYDVGTSVGMQINRGGFMLNSGGYIVQDSTGNKCWTSQGANNNTFRYGIRTNESSKATEAFSSGKLKIEYDVKVPQSQAGVDGNEIYIYTDNNDNAYSYIHTVASSAGGAEMYFAKQHNRWAKVTKNDKDNVC